MRDHPRLLLPILLAAAAALPACATTAGKKPVDGVLDARRAAVTDFRDMVGDLATVRMVFVGESHTNSEHHEIQRRIIDALAAANPHVIVGLEMLQQPYQEVLDRWSAGALSEDDFLREVNWYGQWSDWDLYGPILRLCRDRHLKVVGLHLYGLGPGGVISREVAKVGLENIPPWMRAQLPDEIDTSNKAHRKAIREIFSGHGGMEMSEERFQRFYESQCSWDETFAENAAKALAASPFPDSVVVVLAGGMHVKDFVSVPERARRRNGLDYRVVLPMERDAFPEEGLAVGPGRTADYILFTGPSRDPSAPRLGVGMRGGDTLVTDVAEGTAAKEAGLQPGDILVGVDDRAIRDVVDIKLVLEGKAAGTKVRIRWTRDGAAMEGTGALTVPASPFAPPPRKDAPAKDGGKAPPK